MLKKPGEVPRKWPVTPLARCAIAAVSNPILRAQPVLMHRRAGPNAILACCLVMLALAGCSGSGFGYRAILLGTAPHAHLHVDLDENSEACKLKCSALKSEMP